MNTSILKLCSIIAVALLLQACPIDDLPCEGVDENRYIISNPGLLSVYPEQTIFEVGDTIWVESSISSQQVSNTGHQIDIYQDLRVNELTFGPILFYKEHNSENFQSKLHSIYVVSGGFREIANENFQELYLSYVNGSYTIKIGYILENTGYYTFLDPYNNRLRVFAKKGNGCGEKYTIYTSLANPNNGYAYEFEVVE